jgi:parallel beta-helix repeat protein
METEIVKKAIVFGIIMLFVGTGVIPTLEAYEKNAIYVDDDNTAGPWDGTTEHPYQYIQDATDIATSNDTIYVCHGIYNENLLINKTKSGINIFGGHEDLIGNDTGGSIIDGRNLGHVIRLGGDKPGDAVNDITISNFKIYNTTYNGINLGYADHITVNNSIIQYCNYGIYSTYGNNNLFEENIISHNAVGIYFRMEDHSTIGPHNYIGDNDINGIWLENSNNNQIQYNEIKNNTNYGLLFMGGGFNNNQVRYNNFIDNGIADVYFRNCINRFSDNYWIDGILPIKIIKGIIQSNSLPFVIIPWFQVDWRPAKNPY